MIFSACHFTCSYKVAVKRMCVKMIADRFSSSYKSLTNYLTPKQSLSAGHPVVRPSGKDKNKRTTYGAKMWNYPLPDGARCALKIKCSKSPSLMSTINQEPILSPSGKVIF